MRHNLPTPSEGFVVEDLDLIVLRFGPLENRPYSEDGRFMLIEIKQKDKPLGYAQRRVFQLIDSILRLGDRKRQFYLGFYVIHWDEREVKVNGRTLSLDDFRMFLLGQLQIPPRW